MMLLKNAYLFTPDKKFVFGSFSVEDGLFKRVMSGVPGETGFDLQGAYVIPGLIDIHTHGCAGADFSDGDPEGLGRMGAWYAQNGITAFAPTSMTLPYETLGRAFALAAEYHRNRPEGCARLAGIHMEGPFFSEKKKGAQNAAYLRLPDFEAFQALQQASGGLIRIVDVAAELDGAVEFTEQACKLCKVSVAHTDADYDEACAVFNAGAGHLTHLFNAMPPIHHRKPGVIGAASERANVVAELICDGLHVHPSAVRMAFRLFPERICLISDALRCCGMPEGEYELGGQRVFLRDGAAHLKDGTLAGSAAALTDCLRNAVRFGIPETEAVTAATLTPARVIGAGEEIGSIEPGKLADFLVCSESLEPEEVYIGGRRI